MFRRDVLKSALLGTAAIATGHIMRPETALAATSAAPLDALSDELDHQLFGDDGLARPIPTQPTVSDLAKGLDRTLALGGGGEYYVAWYCGFFHGLYDHGLDMAALPEMVVGTSAGSYIGSSVTSGHFLRLRTQFEFFGHFPQSSLGSRRSRPRTPASRGR
jgi:NTE family protein